MITYFYWAVVLGLMLSSLYVLGGRYQQWRPALLTAAAVLLTGFIAYYFHFQQIFVKRYGGVMSISVTKGQRHIAATWKDDNLWIENYDPGTNTCHFTEYSRGNLLQGKVTIEQCNPLVLPTAQTETETKMETTVPAQQ